MFAFRALLESRAENDLAKINTNQPIDVALDRTVANFSEPNFPAFADNAAVVEAAKTTQSSLGAFSSPAIDPETLFIGGTMGGHDDSCDSSFFGFHGDDAAAGKLIGGGGPWALKKKSARYRAKADGFPSWSTQLVHPSGDFAAWENADGEPMPISCHTYSFQGWVGNGRIDIGGAAAYKSAFDNMGGVWTYDQYADTLVQYHSDHTVVSGSTTFTDSGWGASIYSPWEYNRWDGNVYTWASASIGSTQPFYRWDRSAKTRSQLAASQSIFGRPEQRAVILPDPSDATKRIFYMHLNDTSFIVARDIESESVTLETYTYRTARPAGGGVDTKFAGYTWDSERNAIARWGGGDRIDHLTVDANFNNWDWSTFMTGGTGDTPSSTGTIYRGFEYIPDHDAYIGVDNGWEVFAIKPHNWNPPALARVRLGLHGAPAAPYGSFEGKAVAPAEAVTARVRIGLHGAPAVPYGSTEDKAQPGGVGIDLAPGTGEVTAEGGTPSVGTGGSFAPGEGAATSDGGGPAIDAGVSLSPGTGEATTDGGGAQMGASVVSVPGRMTLREIPTANMVLMEAPLQ